MKNLMFLAAAKAGTTPKTSSSITNTILTNVINFVGPLIGIAMVIFTLLEAFKIIRGNGGSVKRLITGVLILMFLLGIMYMAGSFATYGETFKTLTGDIVDKTNTEAGNMLK